MTLSRLALMMLSSACVWVVIFAALYGSPGWCVSAAVACVLFAAAALRTKPRKPARYYHPTLPPRL